jgi:hypothetical protein
MVMKPMTAVEAMTASGNYGWPGVSTLVGAQFPVVSTPEYSYFTALRQDYSAHPFHHRRFTFFCGVSRRPSAAWPEGVKLLLAHQGALFPSGC